MLFLLLSCGDKNTEPAPPPVGWHMEEGWTAQCWFPPDFEKLESAEASAPAGWPGRRPWRP